MIVLESRHYYQVRIPPHPQQRHRSLQAIESMLPANAALPDGPRPPAQQPAPRPRNGHRVGGSRHLAPRPCALLPLAVGATPLTTHQGLDGNVVVPPGRPAAAGGHPPA